MVDNCIYKQLDFIHAPISVISTIPKQIVHCQVPFMSVFLNKQLNSEVFKISFNLRLIFNNSMSNFFHLRMSYLYPCETTSCIESAIL